jgi:hypothetical protein
MCAVASSKRAAKISMGKQVNVTVFGEMPSIGETKK